MTTTTKTTERMAAALAETRDQMRFNAEAGDRAMRSAERNLKDGQLPAAIRNYARATADYRMACGYAIALQDWLKGLGVEEGADLDTLCDLQGRYANLSSRAEQKVADFLHGEVYRALRDQAAS